MTHQHALQYRLYETCVPDQRRYDAIFPSYKHLPDRPKTQMVWNYNDWKLHLVDLRRFYCISVKKLQQAVASYIISQAQSQNYFYRHEFSAVINGSLKSALLYLYPGWSEK